MKIGLTYTVREQSASQSRHASRADDFPDDSEEEFDSPETIQSLKGALEQLGHQVMLLGDGESMLRRLVSCPRPELVFNIAEGRGIGRCREARIPAVLEMLGIPCTGSDPLTLAATLDKDCAKKLVRDAGVLTPQSVLVQSSVTEVDEALLKLRPPLIVKPAFEGSSKGVLEKSLVEAHEDLPQLIARFQSAYDQPILVEEYIDGEELTVGVVGNDPPTIIGIMRVLPTAQHKNSRFIYSLEVKRDWRKLVRYECPAKISAKAEEAVRNSVMKAWHALGCRDVSRFDFRLRGDEPFFLEVNPLPGLSPVSGDLVLLSKLAGLEYLDLIDRIVTSAAVRYGLNSHFTSEVSVA